MNLESWRRSNWKEVSLQNGRVDDKVRASTQMSCHTILYGAQVDITRSIAQSRLSSLNVEDTSELGSGR